MERDDDTATGRYTEDVAPGDAPDRPAGPSQPDDGFAEGVGDKEGEITREPDFARGIDEPREDTDQAEGRYSRGAEAPGTEEASGEGRFSEGIEQLPHEDS
jgi:hypothetical protein